MKKIFKTAAAVITSAIAMTILAIAVSAAEAPAGITGLKQTYASTSYVRVSWNAAGGADYYVAEISTDGVNFYESDNEKSYSPEATFFGRSPGSTYYIRVRAFASDYQNGDAAGAYSPIVQAVTIPSSVTTATQTNATSNSVTLSFSPVAGATEYRIHSGDGSLLMTTTSTNITVNKLDAGRYQSFYIRTARKSSTGFVAAESYGKFVTANTLPPKVTGIKFTAIYNATKKISFQWNSMPNASGYQFQICKTNGKKSTTVTQTSRYLTINARKYKNAPFKVRVRAYTVINGKRIYNQWSSYKTFVYQPVINSVRRNKTTATIKWYKIANAKKYTIYKATNSKGKYRKAGTVSAKKNTFKLKKLKRRKTYYVYVKAQVKIGKKSYTSPFIMYTYVFR